MAGEIVFWGDPAVGWVDKPSIKRMPGGSPGFQPSLGAQIIPSGNCDELGSRQLSR